MHSSIIAEVYNSISYVYSRISYGNITSEVGEITAIGGFFAAKLDTSGRGFTWISKQDYYTLLAYPSIIDTKLLKCTVRLSILVVLLS